MVEPANDDAERLAHEIIEKFIWEGRFLTNGEPSQTSIAQMVSKIAAALREAHEERDRAINRSLQFERGIEGALQERDAAREEAEGWRDLVARYENDGLQEEVERLRSQLKLDQTEGINARIFIEREGLWEKYCTWANARSQPATPSPKPIYTGEKPTIHELEEILERQGNDAIAINPDGSITTVSSVSTDTDNDSKQPSPKSSGASPEDVERAREIVNVLGEQDEIGLISIEAAELVDELAVALTARGAEGERAGLERAAQECEAEAKKWHDPWPSQQCAVAIRTLLPPAPEK